MPWYILSLLSAASAASASFAEKRALTTMRSLAFSLRVAYLVALVSIPVLIFTGLKNFGSKEILMVAGASILGAIGYVRVVHGIRRLDVGEYGPLLLLSPALTALLAYLLIGESIGRIQVAGIIIIFLGAYFLEAHRGGIRGILKQLSAESGMRYLLQGVIIYAITAVIDRVLLGVYGLDPVVYLCIAQIAIAITMTLYAVVTRNTKHVAAALALPASTCVDIDDPKCELSIKTSRSEWFVTLFITVTTLLNRFFFVFAAAVAPIGPVTALRRSSSLFSAFFDTGEGKPRWRRVIACTFMLAGVIMAAM
jgi:drug/metabolite transporter (DMT)-like permease